MRLLFVVSGSRVNSLLPLFVWSLLENYLMAFIVYIVGAKTIFMFIITSARFLKIFTRGFAKAITLYPFIIVNSNTLKSDPVLMNHEQIHIKQQLELLIIFFYILYLAEYVLYRWRGMNHTDAYHNISLEKEAYANEGDENYLSKRKRWAFSNYLGGL